MKVLHLISGGDTGGAKTSLYSLLTELQKLMTVRLICFIEGDFAEGAKALGVDVVVLPQKGRFDLSVVTTLDKMVLEEGFDIINCHGARANFIGAFLKNKSRVPLISTIHSDLVHDFDNSLYKKIFYTTFNWISLKKMSAYITMAEKTQKEFVAKGFKVNKTYIGYNGIPMTKKKSDMSFEDFGKKYGITREENVFYVGTAARLHPIKGVDVFLRAAKNVSEHTKEIKFLVAGGGEELYEKKYKQYVSQNGLEDSVYFLGFVKEMDVFYEWIDVNALSSHSEAFPYALLEGGKYEKPTIATRVGGIPELIIHQENGLMFEDSRDDELADGIMTYYHDPAFAKLMGEKLYETVDTKFSDHAMASRYEEIYHKILERYKR